MPFLNNCNSWLPGSRSFLGHSAMFRVTKPAAQPSYQQLFEMLTASLRTGNYRPGEGFPNSRQLVGLTGASPIDSLKAVTKLLKAGAVRQLPTGQLVVVRAEVGSGTGPQRRFGR